MEKYSIFNTKLNVTSGSLVLYNSKSDKCLVVKREKEALLTSKPEFLIRNDEKLYNDLLSINAIIPSNYNELEEIITKSKEITNSENEFTLIINPTLNCNFNCWYCYESHIKGSQISKSVSNNILLLIDKTLENKNLKRFIISFFGGEPLMYYDKTTRLVIDYLRGKYIQYENIEFSIMFTSNGYLLNDNILSHLIANKESKHFQITLDGAKDFHNKTRVSNKEEGSYNKIINSIKILISNNIRVLLRINYTSENIDSTIDILDDIKYIDKECRENLTIGFFRIWQDDKNIDLKEKVEKFRLKFKSENFIIDDNETVLDSLKNPCYADMSNEIVINFNGDIYKCTARDFNQANKYGKLNDEGSVDWIDERLRDWGNSKIKSKSCQSCRILPLCGGGCHQINLESMDSDTCLFGHSESDKDNIIFMRLEKYFISDAI